MNAPRPRLAQAVLPEITEGRVARQWASIESRLPRRSATRGAGLYLSVATLPLLAAGLYWYTQRGAVPTTGSVIDSASTPVTVTLRDGSTLGLDAQTRLRLLRDEAQAVDVELGSGKANFDVTHVEGRAFRVHAGMVLVKVLGTRFEVAKTPRREGTHVQVAVARGVVEVQRQDGTGGVRRLTAGETWSALIAPGSEAANPERRLAPAAAPARPSAPSSSEAAAPAPIAEPPAVTPANTDSFTPERSKSWTASERRNARVRAVAQARERANASAELFKAANLARRTGQMQEAAAAYTELLRRFPTDGRAGLVAFELGRIRMDALAQPKAAVEAFELALRYSPRASYREDALARIVVATDQLGAREACSVARDEYLRDFSDGVHALSLAGRCGGQ